MLKNFHFINNKKTTLIIVGVVLLVGILSFVIRGFNLDIDFTGGYELTSIWARPPLLRSHPM